MGKLVSFLIIGILFIGSFFAFADKSDAAKLSQALLRLDRMSAGTATGGMICAEPGSIATEGRVAVTFPGDFSVNTNSANWTVSTDDIPNGATPWPGIGPAISVSGKTVVFPSGNISGGNFYCFSFAGSGTLTTGSAGDKEGTIATQTAAGAGIDSTTYGVTIKNTDSVTVTASVAGFPTDFDAKMSLIDPPYEVFNENTVLTYKLAYGSNINQDVSATLEAEWSLGSIGNSTPTINILDYVVGSASDALGGTAPVIDTVNRRITWTFTLPANTEQEEVTFKLRTNDNYRGSSQVSFNVAGRVSAIQTQTPDSVVTKKYLYSNFDPGPPGTPGNNPTSTPGPNTTPAPTGAPQPGAGLTIRDIEMLSIGATSARIGIETNIASTVTIRYGASTDDLSSVINGLDRGLSHSIQLSGLTRATRYYFTVTATDASGVSITSDIFSFATASSDTNIPKVTPQSLILIANNKVLFSPITDFELLELADINNLQNEIFVVLSTVFPFEFRIGISENQKITRVIGFIRSSEVLGIDNTSEQTPAENDIELFEITPGVYSGRLLTKKEPGIYDLYVRIYDSDGNISEQEIAKIRVVAPLSVASKKTNRGIENAKITLYVYNPKTRLYSFIPPDTYPIKNPAYTETDGTLRLALPNGKYRVEVEAIGYKRATEEFVIGESPEEKYPQILLEEEPFSIISFVRYYATTITDLFRSTKSFTASLSDSFRFFDLIAITTLTLLIATTLFSFSVRTHIHLQNIPIFLYFYGRALIFGHSKQQYIHGEILDLANGKSLSRALVEVFDDTTGRLLGKTFTNQAGEFYIKRVPAERYKITVSKHGYHSHSIADYTEHTIIGKQQFFIESKDETYTLSPSRFVVGGLENLFGITFETLLIACLFFELIFMSTIGLWQTLPFLVITSLTLLMWVFYASRILRKVISPAY